MRPRVAIPHSGSGHLVRASLRAASARHGHSGSADCVPITSGKIVKVHRRNVNYKGYVHHATPGEPQYEIKSDKTDYVASHKAAVLRHLS
jgi:hypothetical protein